MKQRLKEFVKILPSYPVLRRMLVSMRQKKELFDWEKNGRPAPPPHIIKQQAIKKYAEKFGLKVFVETGTYYGDMVDAVKNHFKIIYSIELSKKLYEKAKKRFFGDKRVHIIHGNSAIVLGNLVPNLKQPALFFLDGHYSAGETVRADKDTPIYEELGHIFNNKQFDHVVIIDDARCFGSDPAYPSIKKVTKFILEKRKLVEITVKNDSIRIVPSHKHH